MHTRTSSACSNAGISRNTAALCPSTKSSSSSTNGRGSAGARSHLSIASFAARTGAGTAVKHHAEPCALPQEDVVHAMHLNTLFCGPAAIFYVAFLSYTHTAHNIW